MAHVREYIHPKTGERYPIGGCIVSNRSPKLVASDGSPFRHKHLPPVVDLRPFMTPVEHQGRSQACGANAMAGVYEFLVKRNTGRHIDVSRLFIYYNARLKDGWNPHAMQDGGCDLKSVVAAVTDYGCCTEDIWRYSLDSINRKPSPEAYSKAKRFRVTSVQYIPTNLTSMKSCLADGYPFIFALNLFKSFHRAATKDGRVPMPRPRERVLADHGWHGMVAVGYSDRSQCFIVRNSWGARWGDQGYCYIPYEYMASPNVCADIFVVKKISVMPPHPRKCAAANPHEPQDADDDFDSRQFWRQNDTYNYYLGSELSNDPNDFTIRKKYNGIPDAFTAFIIWIDTETHLKDTCERELKRTHRAEIEFSQTYSQGADYILQYHNQIRSSMFQIVCRGYFSRENKNALDLLDLLTDLHLSHLPILVITKHKADIVSRYNIQAPQMDLQNWEEQIFIADNPEQLLKTLKHNIDRKLSRR